MGSSQVRITVLGSGTSSGVPTIGCSCAVCQSTDPRDKRLRPSVLLRYQDTRAHGAASAVEGSGAGPAASRGAGEGAGQGQSPAMTRSVIIDTTPDFRQQALRAGLTRLDAVLYTHAHADHILGLDDVRPFNFYQRETIPLYANPETLAAIRRVFAYAFAEAQSSVPKLDLHCMNGEPFDLFGLRFTPVRLEHGEGTTFGFRFGAAAYLTDHSGVPEESRALLRGLDVLFLDALRHRPHRTHTTVADALKLIEELQPKRAFFTHMSHDLGHAATEAELPPHVRLAYDGLELEVERAA